MNDIDIKRCSKCGEEKPLDEFYRYANGKPASACKVCKRKHSTDHIKQISQNPNKIQILIKICYECGVEKSAEQFYKNKARIDGLTDECKECSKDRIHRHKVKNSANTNKLIVEKKICWCCGVEKNANEFGNNKSTIDGLSSECKECHAEYDKQYRAKNKEYCAEYNKQYRIEHADQIAYKQKHYQEKNRNKINKYANDRFQNDLGYKIAKSLRNRLWKAIRNGQKTGSAVADLGCSIAELKAHLEQQFYSHPGTDEAMTWENWSIDGWHIDHIEPLDSFDLTDREQFLRAAHYTNLQPLWADENLRKSNKKER